MIPQNDGHLLELFCILIFHCRETFLFLFRSSGVTKKNGRGETQSFLRFLSVKLTYTFTAVSKFSRGG
jgi:hypothetical protein